MHTCSCGVAQKFRKCHEPEHIQALDYRIHVFEKMGRLENAQRDAEWLLDIAPRALEVRIPCLISPKTLDLLC
jgi:hypothetical protein